MKRFSKILLGLLVVASVTTGFIYIKNSGDNVQAMLLAHGAKEDCTTDDHVALQAVFDAIPAGQIAKFPAGICLAISSGVTVKSAVIGIDFNGAIINAAGMTSGYAFSITPNLVAPYNNQQTAQLPIENFILKGPASESNVTDGMFIGGSGTGAISGQTLSNFHITGFRDGMYIGDYTYINSVFNGNVENNYRYGLNYVAVTTAGESFNWHGGRFANNNKSDGSAIAIYIPSTDNGTNELFLYGTVIDYNDKGCSINAGQLNLFGVHLEDNHYANSFCDIAWNSGDYPAGVFMYGGEVGMTESSANSRASIFTINGTKAFFVASTFYSPFDHSSELVHAVSGNPHIDLTGTEIDYSGSTKFATLPANVNLLFNGDGEQNNTNGWNTSGTNYTFTSDTGVFHSGTHSLKMVSTGTSNGSLREYVRVRPGQRVIWDCWVNDTALTAGNLFLNTSFLEANPESTTTFQVSTDATGSWSATTAGWVEVRRTVIAPIGAGYAEIELKGVAWTGTAYLDDCGIWVF